jgi:hypothetical protein
MTEPPCFLVRPRKKAGCSLAYNWIEAKVKAA